MVETTQGNPPFVMKKLSREAFTAYVDSYSFGPIPPGFLVLHHTVNPTVASWKGKRTMLAMQEYYARLGWTAGPHIFCAPDGIWLATPMTSIGVHANSGNTGVKDGLPTFSIGVEMVGNADLNLPRGEVWANTLHVLGTLSRRLNLTLADIHFHREYNSAKSCPGKKVTHEWVNSELLNWYSQRPVDTTLEPLTISKSPPRIDEDTFVSILQLNNSPAVAAGATVGRDLYRICLSEGVDPAVALAFFEHESKYGRLGLTALHDLKNWGNVRSPEDKNLGTRVMIPGRGYFAKYPSWQNGLLDWCYRLRGPKYAGQGLLTVDQVVPKYAPPSDGNSPEVYINAVKRSVKEYTNHQASATVEVLADVLNIRQGPATTYPVAGQLRKGERVQIDGDKVESERVWLHLRDGRGFIKKDYTRFV